ncbi:hypothetical protein J6590_071650 [Homalodisca vitripennis]|nr:hypothetical protein J6590_071650 [Homalodisca vitripennis]
MGQEAKMYLKAKLQGINQPRVNLSSEENVTDMKMFTHAGVNSGCLTMIFNLGIHSSKAVISGNDDFLDPMLFYPTVQPQMSVQWLGWFLLLADNLYAILTWTLFRSKETS